MDGFGDPDNSCSYCMTVFNNHLYIGTGNEVAQVWRTEDGVIWKQVNIDGFGDNDNKRVHSLIVFDDYLYAGTGNKKGTEIWRCKVSGKGVNPCFFETMFKNEPQRLYALRVIRDTILRSVPGGSEYVKLYYRYSSEIAEICDVHPEIKVRTFKALEQLMPGIILVSERGKKEFGSLMIRELLSLLEEYAKVGGPSLQLAVEKVKGKLKNGNLPTLLRCGEIEMIGKNY
jgi:hypothetical protein